MKNSIIATLAACFSLPVVASTVSVDYSSDDDRTIRYIDVQRGYPIKFEVKNACDEFQIAYRGYRPRPTTDDQGGQEDFGDYKCENYCAGGEQISTEVVHSSQFEGYEFRVEVPSGITRIVTDDDGNAVKVSDFCEAASGKFGEKTEDIIRNATDADIVDGYKIQSVASQQYLVVVDQSPWEVDFSVGPVVSWLTSPVYYLDDMNTITRNTQAEDDVELIVAGFAHVSNRNCRWNVFGREYDCSNLALTGGVGTSTGSSLDYFIGGSRKYGPAMLTVGAHWGSIYRLPNEYVVGDTTTDVTVVTESGMEERTDVAFFLSLTYTFGAGANESAFARSIARIGD